MSNPGQVPSTAVPPAAPATALTTSATTTTAQPTATAATTPVPTATVANQQQPASAEDPAGSDSRMEDVDPSPAEQPNGSSGLKPAKDGPDDGSSATNPSGPSRLPGLTAQEPKIPVKKDVTLREFLGKMDDYSPIIPDAVVNYYLTLAGLPPPPQTPLHLARLLALATQKFVADVATDAYQYSRIRSANGAGGNPIGGGGGAANFAGTAAGAANAAAALGGAAAKDGNMAGKNASLGVQRPGFGGGGQGGSQGRVVLTMEDLGMAIGEYGVNIKRSEFYR